MRTEQAPAQPKAGLFSCVGVGHAPTPAGVASRRGLHLFRSPSESIPPYFGPLSLMIRRPFYEIDKSTYLFPSCSAQSGERGNPEEPVRQWCAFELLRAYGIPIGNIEFERKVRIGSKTYEIDILVCRDGKPWIVVECKEPAHTKHVAAMEQAVSYASGQEIRAEFAVYTNGHIWNVQRRFKNNWIPASSSREYGPRHRPKF